MYINIGYKITTIRDERNVVEGSGTETIILLKQSFKEVSV